MKFRLLFLATLIISSFSFAQNMMTPETLWSLGRVSGKGISKDGKYVIFAVSTPDIAENKSNSKTYIIPITGGDPTVITSTADYLSNSKVSQTVSIS
jgi:hypothetical protein